MPQKSFRAALPDTLVPPSTAYIKWMLQCKFINTCKSVNVSVSRWSCQPSLIHTKECFASQRASTQQQALL